MKLYAYNAITSVIYYDSSGESFIGAIIIFVVAIVVIIGADNVKAYKTVKSLNSEGWELAVYTMSGLINVQINFDFNSEGNNYYNMYTAGLYVTYFK